MKPLLARLKGKVINLLEGNPPTVIFEEITVEPEIVETVTIETKSSEQRNLELLKEVLSVPTKYRQEDMMIMFLYEYFDGKSGYESFVDGVGNVYVTKGKAEHYPCVVAHIDTVHEIDTTLTVVQEDNILFAVDENNKRIGIGGDDKNGVYIALRMLQEFDNIKAVFFVSEEIGCLGSRAADGDFFNNVGYAVQFDAPDDYMVTYYCDGTKLFEINSPFYQTAEPIILKHFGDKMQLFKHPYTDVSILKRRFDFSCINLSCGYYNMHSSKEYVKIDVVEDSVELGKELIEALGENLYFFKRIYD